MEWQHGNSEAWLHGMAWHGPGRHGTAWHFGAWAWHGMARVVHQASLHAASWPTIPAEQGSQARITWPSLRLEVSRAVSRAASCGRHGMTS